MLTTKLLVHELFYCIRVNSHCVFGDIVDIIEDIIITNTFNIATSKHHSCLSVQIS